MDLTRLPKWAQEYIRDLERQRDMAVLALQEYCDVSTLSAFYVDELECTNSGAPTQYRRYIQTHKITVEYEGVCLEVMTRPFSNGDGIELQWSTPERTTGDIAAIPKSFNRIELKTKEHMR